MSLSLSPRYDLVRFAFDKDFLPEPVTKKWHKFLLKNPGVISTPIDYLNESIRGITFPGISDLTITQSQHSSNSITRTGNRINVEPKQDNATGTPANPLDRIERNITVKFRLNQGLYNYWMLYETIFYRICKPWLYDKGDDMFIDVLNETGNPVCRVKLYQCHITGLDGLEFAFDKVERQSDEFSLTFTFNNIDCDFADELVADSED
jgi:hypothetical protein